MLLNFRITVLFFALPVLAHAQPPGAEPFRRSYAAEAAGDYATALTALDGVGRCDSDYVCALRRGWLLYLAGRHPEAAAAYQRAIQLEGEATEPRLGLMLPLLAQRRWREAEQQARAILALVPSESTARGRLAYIHYSQGRFDLAEGEYRRLVQESPANVDLRAGLAWSLLKQRRFVDARAQLERILACAPDHASAKQGLALLP